MVSTSFQIAGCVGTSLAADVYCAVSTANTRAGDSEFYSLLTGFRGGGGVVAIPSLVGTVSRSAINHLAIASYLDARDDTLQPVGAPVSPDA